MIANKVYTRDEMREEHIITTDYHFIDKEGEYFAKLIMRAEASKNMMRLFFQLSDGRKIITPVFWWQSYLGFYEIDNGTNLRLVYKQNGKGISLKVIEILDLGDIEMQETIKNINIDLLIPFENHPFKKRDGIENEELKESVKENGLLQPIIVRSFSAGTFEIISGHRRVEVCRELGIPTIPAIVRDITKDEAIIAMVDSNLQREHLLPSEKAFAYKMKLEAMKHQGKTSCQIGAKSRTDEQIAETVNDSARQVQRYIRLTYLVPELLKLVDEERIAFTPAVELSYLPANEQKMLAEEIEYTDATPSLSQAQRLRKFSEQGRLSIDTIFAVLSEEKPNQKEQVKFKTEDIRKYFPKSYTSLDMQKTIITLLEKWQRQRERNRGEAR